MLSERRDRVVWGGNRDKNAEHAQPPAGAQRMRVWRPYLRAARRGFENAITSIFQSSTGGARPEFGGFTAG